MNAQQTANYVLWTLANDAVIAKAERLVAEGEAEWVFDPEVDGVVGLLRRGSNTALVLVSVYADDFETSAEFDALAD